VCVDLGGGSGEEDGVSGRLERGAIDVVGAMFEGAGDT
jgi:hypothetical protein